MKTIRWFNFLVFFILIGALACTPGGIAPFGGPEDITTEGAGITSGATGEEGEVDSGGSYVNPSDEGFGIPVTTAKVILPPIDARFLTAWMGEHSAEEDDDEGNFFSTLIFGRKAYAAEQSNICHIQCENCVKLKELPEGTTVTVVIENTASGEETEIIPSSVGSFYTTLKCEPYDPLNIYLTDVDDSSFISPNIVLTLTGGTFFDLAITQTPIDHGRPFTSHFVTDVGFMTNPDKFVVSEISLAGGLEIPLFESTSNVLGTQWGFGGMFVTFMKPNKAVFLFNTVSKKFFRIDKPTLNRRRAVLNPAGSFLAIGDLPASGDIVTIRIISMKTGKQMASYEVFDSLINFQLRFIPKTNNLLLVGKKYFFSGKTGLKTMGTVIYRIGEQGKEDDVVKIFGGPFKILEWIPAQDSSGIVFTMKDPNNNEQILYQSFTDSWLPKQLTDNTGLRQALSFSKNGRWLAYTRTLPNAKPLIYLLDFSDTSPDEIQFTNGIDGYYRPLFGSKDNVLSYITADADGYHQIHVKNLDLLPFLPLPKQFFQTP